MQNERMEDVVNPQTETFEQDYARLESAKKELFNKLTEESDVSVAERDYLIYRIFEHSTEDGLDVADMVTLGRQERIAAITRPEFVQKHRTFALNLGNRLVEYQIYAGKDDKAEFDELTDTLTDRVGQSKTLDLPERKPAPALGEKSKELLDQIDHYYANFLRFRKLKTNEAPVPELSRGEQIGERALALDEKGLEPHYYTGPIRDQFPELDSPLLKDSIISQKDLNQLFSSSNLSVESEEIKSKIEKARFRPLDVVHDIYHKDAEKILTQELVGSIKSRGYKDKEFELVFDEETQQYKILNKVKETAEFKKKNLRVIQEAPARIEMKPGDPYYDVIYRGMNPGERGEKSGGVFQPFVRNEIIDGKLYRNVSNRGHDGFLIYPDGHRSKLRFVIEHPKMTKHGLAFTTNDHDRRDGTNNFQIVVNEKRISEDDVWDKDTHSLVESKDGSIYYVAHQFDYGMQIGRHAIFKDDQMLVSYPYNKRIEHLSFVGGRLTYILEEKDESSLICGDRTYGPYKKIVTAEGSNTLTFAAEDGNGDKIIFSSGKKKSVSVEGELQGIVKAGGKNYLLISKVVEKGEAPWQDKKVKFIVDQDGNKISNESSRLDYFASMGDKLVYSIEENVDKAEFKRILHFGDDKRVETVKTEDMLPIGVLNGDLFYLSGKHSIASFKSGQVNFGKNFQADSRWAKNGVRVVGDKLVILNNDGETLKLLEYSPKFKLTEDETRRLELLTALKSESLETINSYFKKYYPEEVEKGLLDKLRDAYEQSKQFAQNVNTAIRETPSLFLDDLAARKDDTTDRNIDQIINSLFPDIRTNLMRAKDKAKWERDYEMTLSSYYYGGREASDFPDGDPKASGGPELLKLREPVTEFLSMGMYGQYNLGRRSWEQVGFPLSQRHSGPTKEVTAEIPVVEFMENVILPKCLNASVLPERVKGVKANGDEVSLEVSYNALGEARVKLPKGLKKVVYSQTVQELPAIPPDVTASEYDHFRQDYERRFGNGVSDRVANLPEELSVFIESINDKSPLEKAEEIESFVRSVGFYDFDNKEVQGLKLGKSVEEVISVMSQRMKELKHKAPESAENLSHKKYAGVCADFAKLTTALLREAGLISGMAKGLQGGGETSLTTKNAHAISFALFPEENGKSQCLSLDGTPRGMTEDEERMLSAIRQKSLKERMDQLTKEKNKITEDADKLLADLESLVSNLDEEAIKRLQNGHLERALNAILGQVKESHLAVVDRVLNASRYAGFDVSKIIEKGDIDSEVSLRKFLEKEIKDERSEDKKNAYYRGERLLSTIREFAARFERDIGVGDKKMALDIVQKVFDISKKYLNPIESRSAIAAITYLRSEHMSQ